MAEPPDQRDALPQLGQLSGVFRRIPVLRDGVPGVSFESLVSGERACGHEVDPARLAGVFDFLHTLGALRITRAEQDDFLVAYVSERAYDFVNSIALCARQGVTALNTWQLAYRADAPPWGIPLMREMEKRRLAAAVDSAAAEPVRSDEVIAIIVKSRRRRGFRIRDVYLCQLDPVSGCYNFIGGKRRPSESHQETAERKLFEELGLPVGTYKVAPVEMAAGAPPLETRKISNDTGVYTRYTFYLYHAVYISGRGNRARTNRWFDEQELLSGQGSRKERIMAHGEVIGALRSDLNPEHYPRGLASLDLSIRSAGDLQVTRPGQVIEWLVDNREVIAVLAGLASLVYTLLKIFGVL